MLTLWIKQQYYVLADAFGQYISAQESFWQQKEQAIDNVLDECDEDISKNDRLFSYAAEIHIELMTLVCNWFPYVHFWLIILDFSTSLHNKLTWDGV